MQQQWRVVFRFSTVAVPGVEEACRVAQPGPQRRRQPRVAAVVGVLVKNPSLFFWWVLSLRLSQARPGKLIVFSTGRSSAITKGCSKNGGAKMVAHLVKVHHADAHICPCNLAHRLVALAEELIQRGGVEVRRDDRRLVHQLDAYCGGMLRHRPAKPTRLYFPPQRLLCSS